MTKPKFTGWAVFGPDGIQWSTIAKTKNRTLSGILFVAGFSGREVWKELRSKGYRVSKIKIEELNND